MLRCLFLVSSTLLFIKFALTKKKKPQLKLVAETQYYINKLKYVMKQLYMLQNLTLRTLKFKASKSESTHKIKGQFMIETGTSKINIESYPFLMQHHQLIISDTIKLPNKKKAINNKL